MAKSKRKAHRHRIRLADVGPQSGPRSGLVNALVWSAQMIQRGEVEKGIQLASLISRRRVEGAVKNTDSRTAERLAALMLFEMENGTSAIDITPGFISDALDHVLNPAGDLTPEQTDEIEDTCKLIAQHVIAALVSSGYADHVEASIEEFARQRRECDARFGVPRVIPFDADEKDSLAKSWGRKDDDAGKADEKTEAA